MAMELKKTTQTIKNLATLLKDTLMIQVKRTNEIDQQTLLKEQTQDMNLSQTLERLIDQNPTTEEALLRLISKESLMSQSQDLSNLRLLLTQLLTL